MKTKQNTIPPLGRERIRQHRGRSGMTIIELSLSLALMMSLAGVVVYTVSGVGDWKKGREAAISLRTVYVAQKSFLADNPTRAVSSIAAADIVPYLGSGATSIPTVEAVNGSQLAIKVNVMPPVVLTGSSTYDPSGNSTDGLWDVGPY